MSPGYWEWRRSNRSPLLLDVSFPAAPGGVINISKLKTAEQLTCAVFKSPLFIGLDKCLILAPTSGSIKKKRHCLFPSVTQARWYERTKAVFYCFYKIAAVSFF